MSEAYSPDSPNEIVPTGGSLPLSGSPELSMGSDNLYRAPTNTDEHRRRKTLYEAWMLAALRKKRGAATVMRVADLATLHKFCVAAYAACERHIGFSSLDVCGPLSDSSPVRDYALAVVMEHIGETFAEHVAHIMATMRGMKDESADTVISFTFSKTGGAYLCGKILHPQIITSATGEITEIIPPAPNRIWDDAKPDIFKMDIPVRIIRDKDDHFALTVRTALENAYRSVLSARLDADIVDTVEANFGEPSRDLRRGNMPPGLWVNRDCVPSK